MLKIDLKKNMFLIVYGNPNIHSKQKYSIKAT